MALSPSLNVALKEWDVVCRALAGGEQILLLRKGGIHDIEGVFQLEEQQFLFFPTFLHQKPEMLKPSALEGFQAQATEPEVVNISAAAEVTDILRIDRRAQIDAVDSAHVWAAAQIDMRFIYKPHNPLYLIVLRAYRLATMVQVQNTSAYAGCKSWVPLQRSIDTHGAMPALDDARFEQKRADLLEKIHSA